MAKTSCLDRSTVLVQSCKHVGLILERQSTSSTFSDMLGISEPLVAAGDILPVRHIDLLHNKQKSESHQCTGPVIPMILVIVRDA